MNIRALGVKFEMRCTALKIESDDKFHVFSWGYLCAKIIGNAFRVHSWENILFWGFRSCVAEGSVLLGCDTTSVDNKIPTYQGHIVSSSSRVNKSFILGPTEDTILHETLGSNWQCNISQGSRIIWIYVLCQGGWLWALQDNMPFGFLMLTISQPLMQLCVRTRSGSKCLAEQTSV